MRLIRLKINDKNGFRSLNTGFEIKFLQNYEKGISKDINPYVLVGPNGSGKSNILEALSSIFYHMECMTITVPNNFLYDDEENQDGFQFNKSYPDAFELEYLINKQYLLELYKCKRFAHIKILKQENKSPIVICMNREDGEDILEPIKNIKDVLPDHILGYSSGENEVLSLPFFKMRFINLDNYFDALLDRTGYSGKPESRMVYLDSDYSQAILLSNFLMSNEESLKPFEDYIGISSIEKFRIIIKRYINLDKYPSILEKIQSIDQMKQLDNDKYNFNNIIEKRINSKEEEYIFLKITDQLECINDEKEDIEDKSMKQPIRRIIDKFVECSTCHFYDEESGELIIDYYVNDATKEAFKYHFSTSVELFQSFQILLTLNLFSTEDTIKKELYSSNSLYIEETIPILKSDERVMRFKDLEIRKKNINDSINIKSLSDGEFQLLHTLGLCLLFKNSNCLFLLDEPETHFNPEWKSNFITKLRNCLYVKDSENKVNYKLSDIIITTHTPFLVSDSKSEYVKIISRDKYNNKTIVNQPDFNTFGASVNKITFKAFGKKETIGGYANNELKRLENAINDINKDEIIDYVNNEFGESIEKLLFLNSLEDRDEV